MDVEELEYCGYWIKSNVKALNGGFYVAEGSITPHSPDAVARLMPMLKVGERAFADAGSARTYYVENAKAWIDSLIARKD